MNKALKMLFNRETIVYLIFGALTTLLNLLTFLVLHDYRGVSLVPANIVAWTVGVIFAFFTNKLIVFQSKSFEKKRFFREAAGFLLARLLTLGVDFGLLWFLVKGLSIDGVILDRTLAVGGLGIPVKLSWETVCKAFVNILVIILNYVFSKLIIFTKKTSSGRAAPR